MSRKCLQHPRKCSLIFIQFTQRRFFSKKSIAIPNSQNSTKKLKTAPIFLYFEFFLSKSFYRKFVEVEPYAQWALSVDFECKKNSLDHKKITNVF